ncbi:MAG: pyruvate, phosphate dikinase, partial [Actinomycetes bacterium]
RAKDYRKMEGIADDLGTAVNVQTMVFGNKGDDSGTGVAFTRNPSSGESAPYGDFLVNAQGEDVVAGIRMTEPLSAMGNEFPECHVELISVMSQLENHYRDMCDIEFTIEQGRLFILQTRVGKRTAAAALRMAVEMQSEGMIDKSEAVLRVQPAQLDQLLHPQFDPTAEYDSIAKGLNASPGAAVGKVYFTADEAEAAFEAGERVILVRPETSPDDLHGMIAAEGILTSRGGLVSHAAVVARGMGKPAICGADELNIDLGRRCFSVDRVQADGTTLTTTVLEGEIISINGSTGEVVVGEVAVVEPEPGEHFGIVLGWADEFRTLKVRTNADLPEDCEKALEFGAEGVGLCRTEHMFLGDRLPIVQAMILADTPEAEEAALAALLVQQRIDFEGILKAMDGLPVTVRLLDPPLHEFLPNHDELQARRTAAFIRGSVDPEAEHLWAAVKRWEESNPMLGIRGCRLGILKPALYRLQVRALIEAAVTRKRAGGDPQVEIMVPLTVIRTEMELIDGWIRAEAEAVFAEQGERVEYLVGTMVETPRAAITAGEIAETAEFFSFGTNDLTQMTFGFSRDDVEGRMMPIYLEQKILNVSPFEQLDRSGVGELIRWAKEKGRAVRPDIKLGICGEHGGDPTSVHFCHEIGLDYVSASPYRVPLARLAAAHAALGAGGPGATA